MEQAINICPSISRSLLLTLGSAILAAGGYGLTIDGDTPLHTVIGVLGVAFFGIGIVIGLYSSFLAIAKRPIIKIYPDRIKNFTINKGWQTIHFSEVQTFTETKLDGARFIQVHFLDSKHTPDKALNSTFISKKENLCDLLNQKLKYHATRQPQP